MSEVVIGRLDSVILHNMSAGAPVSVGVRIPTIAVFATGGVVFPTGNSWAVAAEMGGGQHLVDSWFQALARASLGPLDPSLVGSIRTDIERVVAPWLLWQPESNHDDRFWEKAEANLDWQGFGELPTLGHCRPPATTRDSQVLTDQAALDQCFALIAGAANHAEEDE
jgi:hypothetical protein